MQDTRSTRTYQERNNSPCFNRRGRLPEYAIHRISRIYSVVIPALILTPIADWIGARIHPELYVGYNAHSVWPIRVFNSVLCMNEWGFWSVQFFSNVPYWSISYEVAYYILFGVSFFLKGPTRWVLLSIIGLLAGPKILLLLPIWLLGVWVYRSRWHDNITRRTAVLALIGSCVGWVVRGRWRLGGAHR